MTRAVFRISFQNDNRTVSAMTKKIDTFKEEFARFLEQPSRDGLREIIRTQYGELPELDFKADWPESAKVAKHILAMGNSRGGCLVLGISEQDGVMEATGLRSLMDKAALDSGVRRFIPLALMEQLRVMDFSYDASEYPKLVGKAFQVVLVPDDPSNLPFMALAETTGLRKTAIYVRRLASSEEATYEELQGLINRKLATGHSTQHGIDLAGHLLDLRILYSELERFYTQHPTGSFANKLVCNPAFTTIGSRIMLHEPFEDVMKRLIHAKKEQVERILAG